MVGSRDYFDIDNQGNFNVATQGLRQPGSALKPFVYMSAFEKGYTPNTILYDVPTEFVSGDPNCPAVPNYSVAAGTCFHPQNFTDTFLGPVPMRMALAQSMNIIAVKTLYLTGLKNVIALANQLGLSTLTDPARYGLSLVLGGGEVRLIDMVKAYSVLAQDGVMHPQAIVLEVKDPKGTVLESYKDEPKDVVAAQYPRMINSILSDANLRAGLFQSSLGLTVFPGHDVALKTGTTNDYRDAWAMGYTPGLVVGVWAGNNDSKPMQQHGSSILAAVPIWSQFMNAAIDHFPAESFAGADVPVTGKPVIDGATTVNGEAHDILYYVDRSDPLGGQPSNPASDPQFSNWEYAVQAWAGTNPQLFENSTSTSSTSTENIADTTFRDVPVHAQGRN
jgi:membrane peptidoglycan carboxypeptidase